MADLPEFKLSEASKQLHFINAGMDELIVSDNGKNLICAKRTTKINFQRDYRPGKKYIRLQLAQQNFGSSNPMTTVFINPGEVNPESEQKTSDCARE